MSNIHVMERGEVVSNIQIEFYPQGEGTILDSWYRERVPCVGDIVELSGGDQFEVKTRMWTSHRVSSKHSGRRSVVVQLQVSPRTEW